MKKQFTYIVILISIITAKAQQQSYGEDFFDGGGINGFIPGPINGQKGWLAFTSGGDAIAGCILKICRNQHHKPGL